MDAIDVQRSTNNTNDLKLNRLKAMDGLDDANEPFLDDTSSINYRDKRHSMSVKFYGETESHQYEQDENEVWKHHQLQRFEPQPL